MSENVADYFAPEPTVVRFGARSFTVAPLTLRRLGPFARSLRELGEVDVADVVSVAAHTEAIITAVSLATDTPEPALYELEVAELAELAATVIEVNADFFVRRLKPVLDALTVRVSRRVTGALSLLDS